MSAGPPHTSSDGGCLMLLIIIAAFSIMLTSVWNVSATVQANAICSQVCSPRVGKYDDGTCVCGTNNGWAPFEGSEPCYSR